MSELDAAAVGEPPPPYMIFLVVFLFFVTGLLGFLVCHLLKKKGYRCRTWDTDEEEEEEEEDKEGEEKEKQAGSGEDDDEDNQDTVEQILKCIIENEANMEAFKEMLGNQNVCALHDPRLLRKESLGGVPPHHHTVHSGGDRNSCHLCAQGRAKKGRRRSRTPKPKRPGEQTVFSVGRFRVKKKLQESSNPMADSGDQLNQSQDSKDQKEGTEDSKEAGYNLRNMFKDVKQPTESSNGVVPNVGKRRKSLSIFGLGRRGSDPVGMKMASLPGGRVLGTGVKFSQQEPVVLEEPTPVPSSLAISSSLPSHRTFKSPSPETEREGNKVADVYSPGPQQTSTPIAPGFGAASGLPSSSAAPQCPTPSSEGFLPSGTLPSPYSVSTPDVDPGIGESLASITLGSSPSSPFLVKTPSPGSLRTPTSRAALAQSLTPPLLDSRKTPTTESVKTPSSSPALKHSPQLSSVLSRSNQSPTTSLRLGRVPSPSLARTPSPALTLNAAATAGSPSQTPSAALSPDSSQTSPRSTSPRVGGRSGSLASVASQPDKLPGVSVGDTLHGVSLASPSARPGEEGPSGRAASPGQSLSPSLPPEGRVSSVSIVKASPDSKREFSVVTMLEEEEPSESAKTKDKETKTLETSDRDTAKVDVSPSVSKRGDSSVSGSIETLAQDKRLSTVHVVPSVSQGMDAIVELKDIKEVKQDENQEEDGRDDRKQ